MANFTTTFILHSVIPRNNTDTKAFALIVRWWLILLQTMQSVHRDKQTLNYFTDYCCLKIANIVCRVKRLPFLFNNGTFPYQTVTRSDCE